MYLAALAWVFLQKQTPHTGILVSLSFYCLIVTTLARFYYIPAYTVVYVSYNDGINGGIWGYGFLISVSIM